MKYKPILLLVGASGSGKSTLAETLEQNYKLQAIPSYTTRKPRYDGEKGHTFISEEEFDNLNDIIAYAETSGARYCVTQQMFDNEDYTLYVIDNSGVKYLKQNYEGNRPIYVAYITCPLRQRYERMIKRPIDDPVGFALERIVHDVTEFQNVDYDIQIENADGDFDKALSSLYTFYRDKIGGAKNDNGK